MQKLLVLLSNFLSVFALLCSAGILFQSISYKFLFSIQKIASDQIVMHMRNWSQNSINFLRLNSGFSRMFQIIFKDKIDFQN